MRDATELQHVRFSLYSDKGHEHVVEGMIDLEEFLIEVNLSHPHELLLAMRTVAGINAIEFMKEPLP